MNRIALTLAAAVVGCAAQPAVIVPPHLRAQQAEAEQLGSRSPYVVTLSDGDRRWEVALPPTSGGYEVRIPIGDGTPLIDGAPAASAKRAPEPGLGEDAPSADYLQRLAQIHALYARNSYELALVEVSSLLEAHPDDAKLLAMAGTLHLKLGATESARTSWERALALDPENETVLEALESLP